MPKKSTSSHHHHKTLQEIHEDVPAEHYDQGLKRNLFQKFWHSRRFHEVLKFVEDTEGPILDLGCHGGTFTEKILSKNKTKKVYGLDISPLAINLIKKKIPHGKFHVGDAAKLPFQSNFFDQVYCLEMLEHVDEPEEVVHEIRRVLKKGGKGLILVPTDNALFKFVWMLWTMYYPHWRHAHVSSFRNTDLIKLLKKEGLKVTKVKKFNLGMLMIVAFTV